MSKRIIMLIMCVLFTFSAVSCAKTTERTFDPFSPDESEEFDGKLRFGYDGTFKILFLSDMHLCSAKHNNPATLFNINLFLDVEDPDLVIFGGDNTTLETEEEIYESLAFVLEPIIDRKIPWCYVYGNHDRSSVSGEKQEVIYHSFDYCVSADVSELDGEATCCLPVYGYESEEIKYAVWCMDSQDYTAEGVYDCVHTDQIEWYKATAEKMENENGGKINGLMCMHMPVVELRRCILDMEGTGFHGTAMESSTPYNSVCCSELNYGLWDAVTERGDVQMMIFGHDHQNNFTATLDGITVGYTGTFSGNACLNEMIRGTRVVVVREDDTAHPETYFGSIHDWAYKFYID